MVEVTEQTDGPLPLSALLSQLLVAFVIEFDNEFEHQLPHRTTRHGSTADHGPRPWLVSMAMWAHCMRFVPDNGIPAGELALHARLTTKTAEMLLTRMSEWWGYLVVEPDPADTRAKPPRSDWVVRPTTAGRQAQYIWGPLTVVVEDRWRARFGAEAVERLRASLRDIVSQFDIELPDYLPVGGLCLEPQPTRDDDVGPELTLPALMSNALLALALDFEPLTDLSLGAYTSGSVSRLGVCANILRALDAQGTRAADLPALTGVAKMTIDNWLGSLEKHGYVVVAPDAAARGFKVARLTSRGRHARDAYLLWAGTVERRWQDRFGTQAIGAVRQSAERLMGTGAPSLLWQGMEPYPDGWRAQVPRPKTLPHFPVISARGGFPDGN